MLVNIQLVVQLQLSELCDSEIHILLACIGYDYDIRLLTYTHLSTKDST